MSIILGAISFLLLQSLRSLRRKFVYFKEPENCFRASCRKRTKKELMAFKDIGSM